MKPVIVATTTESRADAERIARKVLEKRLAACVQINGPVASFYWWEDVIASENEFQILLKSDEALFKDLERLITEIHPYEVPEIVATEITAISGPYKAWLKGELSQP